jgi:hypothetical protein
MKSSGNPAPDGASPDGNEPEGTGLPGFRTWRAVYIFVLTAFVVYVVLLLALDVMYS